MVRPTQEMRKKLIDIIPGAASESSDVFVEKINVGVGMSVPEQATVNSEGKLQPSGHVSRLGRLEKSQGIKASAKRKAWRTEWLSMVVLKFLPRT